MQLSNRQEQILSLLRGGSGSAAWLADMLDAPSPSVRRDIGVLRLAGHTIQSVNGRYRLAL